jgi:FAD/FMN-containing dehydrogenase
MTLDEPTIQAFTMTMRGPVLGPDDPDYDTTRAIQNGLIDRRPGLIARCTGAADVIAAVNFAREHDLLVAVRGGGHNVAGNAVCDDGLMIDLSPMRGVHVDAKAQTVRAQGGALWGDVDRETQVFGLATPGGAVSTTGVAGLTLHGGFGHLRRKYGLCLDNLLSVDIVTADGQLRVASETENADLFWAVRGAGSNFGVVTSFEFRLHPVGPILMLCAPMYAQADAPYVLRVWRDFMEKAPEDISSIAIFWNVPAGFPDEIAGKPVVIPAAIYAGSAEEGARVLQPLRELATPIADLSGQIPYTAIQTAFDPFWPKGLLTYFKALYVDGLSDDLIDELCRIDAGRPSPMSPLAIWHHGGALQHVSAEATAFGRRDAPYLVSFDSAWTDPQETEPNITWAREGWAAMHRHSSGGVYLNFPGFGEEKEDLLRAAYGPNYERLRTLKAKYDPTNRFRMNFNIPPAV